LPGTVHPPKPWTSPAALLSCHLPSLR
jgi:hypothetical protein